MQLKKTAVLFAAAAMLLCGCSADNSDENTALTMSEQTETSLYQLIENTLNSYYWRYDSDSIIFDNGKIPTDDDALNASSESGYDMSSKKGSDCIYASADLLYFNREKAGTVYFYFISNKLTGIYYIPENISTPCSMYVRNPYLVASPLSMVETDAEYVYTKKYAPKSDIIGVFDSIKVGSNVYTAFTDGTKLTINRSTPESSFYTSRVIDYSSDGLVPMSAAFINNSSQMAVLFGTETYSEGGAVPITVPKEILIFDSDFSPVGEVIDASDCYSVGYDNGCLIVSRNEAIDFYTLDGTSVSPKQISYYIGKSIVGMDITDIDGDGESEFIFTDGQDLYLYKKTISVFKCVWSTHMSMDSYEKYISAADLNNDGIKEIYVYDSTGTTSKYIIGKNGLSTGNDDIDYGQRWYISDFNADGKSDALVVGNFDSNTQELRVNN